MRKLLIIMILTVGFGCATPIIAQDAPKAEAAPVVEAPKAEAPKEEASADATAEKKDETKTEEKTEGDTASASWVEGNFHIIVAGLLSILAALGILGKAKSWIKNKAGLKSDKLFEFVEVSVTEVYNNYVRDLKAVGHKLTKEEAAGARTRAIKRIKDKASKDGMKIASEALLPVLIEKAINGIRNKG